MSERHRDEPKASMSPVSLPVDAREAAVERRPRFIAFDADPETDGILEKVGVGGVRCENREQFSAALTLPSTLMVVMTHGYACFPDWVSDHGRGNAKQEVEIAAVAPEQFDCDALVLTVCNQYRPSAWLRRLRPGAILASSPDLVSTSAIGSFASGLLAADVTSRPQFEAVRKDVGRRCSTLLSRRWVVWERKAPPAFSSIRRSAV